MSRSPGPASFTLIPSIERLPALMSSRPAIIRSRVDLPQPEGPTITMNSLSRTVKETSSIAFFGSWPRPSAAYTFDMCCKLSSAIKEILFDDCDPASEVRFARRYNILVLMRDNTGTEHYIMQVHLMADGRGQLRRCLQQGLLVFQPEDRLGIVPVQDRPKSSVASYFAIVFDSVI